MAELGLSCTGRPVLTQHNVCPRLREEAVQWPAHTPETGK